MLELAIILLIACLIWANMPFPNPVKLAGWIILAFIFVTQILFVIL